MTDQATKLYIGNLPYSVTSDSLKAAFAQFGDIAEATVVVDKFSKRSRGFGFVEYTGENAVQAAQAAIDGMNEKELDGRKIFVSVARPKKDNDRGQA